MKSNLKIKKSVFDEEISMCQNLHEKQGGCNWGKCKNCGVIPLLYKLHKGILLENEKSVVSLKKEVFGKNDL